MTDVRFQFPRTGDHRVDRSIANIGRILGEYDDEVQAALVTKQAVTAILTGLLALDPALNVMLVGDGEDWTTIPAPVPGADRTLTWNDTTSVIEWS